MFYSLKKVGDHPCFKMQSIVNALLWSAIQAEVFGENNYPAWFRPTFRRATAVRAKLEEVHQALLSETQDFRKQIYSQFVNNNAVEILCDNEIFEIESVIDWRTNLGKNIKALLKLLYSSLDLAIFKRPGCRIKPLHRYYSEFIRSNKYVCPFCFINQYRNRLSTRRADLDHYLCVSTYPFDAANMENLIPMCTECNQDYKKNNSVLECSGVRTVAFYPYGPVPDMRITVSCTRYPSTEDLDDRGDWTVEIVCSDTSQNRKLETWDRVFQIKKRLADEVEEYHQYWIESELVQQDPDVFATLLDFKNFLIERANRTQEQSMRRMEPKLIIKAALFNFLANSGDNIFLQSFMRQYEANKLVAA